MITGIGTDIVEIARFIPWIDAPRKQLNSIFSEQEIADCFTENAPANQIAQRLAARFAAKEAFYKALSATLVALKIFPKDNFSFLFCARKIAIEQGALGVPTFKVNWEPFYEKIGQTLPALTSHLSLSHEKHNALAFVVISRES